MCERLRDISTTFFYVGDPSLEPQSENEIGVAVWQCGTLIQSITLLTLCLSFDN